jgi:MerR HTH family regulatory protein
VFGCSPTPELVAELPRARARQRRRRPEPCKISVTLLGHTVTETFTVNEVAHHLELPQKVLRTWLAKGHVRGFRVNRQWRIYDFEFLRLQTSYQWYRRKLSRLIDTPMCGGLVRAASQGGDHNAEAL